MSNTASGFLCVGCLGDGPHHIQTYEWDEDHRDLISLRLSCHRCEHVWTEDLTDYETLPD
jgi:hypothetical protein